MTAAGLTFLSWVRTGLAGTLAAPVGSTDNLLDVPPPARAVLPVTVDIDGLGPIPFDAHVATAGDVVGLDPAQVIRMEPPDGALGVAPNYLPLVEFDRPDLPWVFTPMPPHEGTLGDPDKRRGLRPWLCLVVVDDRPLDAPTVTRPLPRLTASVNELPDLTTSWLWAHAQVLTTGAADESLEDLLRGAPDRTLSRLLAPRRLRPNRAYLACVVPTFDAGRRAGLGLPAAGAGLVAAWSAPATRVELPVYHHWRFTTGDPGDFEALARKLEPATLAHAGVRPLDVGSADPTLPGPNRGAPPWTMSSEGLIVGSEVAVGDWPDDWAESLRKALAARLDGGTLRLAPPVYGARHIGFGGSLAAGAGPAWLRQLNLDPRYRSTAALGTRVVQDHQEALMAAAWEQSAAVREANRLLRQAQLARAVGETIAASRVNPSQLGNDRFLQVTQPVHNQAATTLPNVRTVARALAANDSVAAAVQVPFRRLTRPRGPLARRLHDAAPAPVTALALPLDSPQRLRAAPPLAAPGGTVKFDDVTIDDPLLGLSPARVRRPRLPWEAGSRAPAAPAALAAGAGPPPGEPSTPLPPAPPAYLADLVVTTRNRPPLEWQTPSWTASLGRALDFDGVPQLGWERLSSPPVTGIGLTGRPYYAAAYADLPERTGIVGFHITSYYADVNVLVGHYSWTPGFLLEQTPFPGTQTHSMPTPFARADELLGIAVATTDLTGTGKLDAIFVAGWRSDNARPMHFTVARDLGPAGTFADLHDRGPIGGGATAGISAAAAGRQLVVLAGRALHLVYLTQDGRPDEGWPGARGRGTLHLGANVPDDYVGGAIAAADFGGSTGVDVLLFYVAGRPGALRAGYRIAYEVQPSGLVGAWGPPLPAPIHVAGPEVGLLVGASVPETTARRKTATAAFREAAAATQSRLMRVLPAGTASAQAAPPAVDAGTLVDEIATAVEPTQTVPASVAARLPLLTTIDAGDVSDVLQPLALTPRYHYPTYELLRDLAQDRLFPGASALLDNRVAALLENRCTLEAFLVGLNHEMARELLWRGFPLRYGSYFTAFWDGAIDDIDPLEGWTADVALGGHRSARPDDGDRLLLVVRAELLRRFPDATVFAVPARSSGADRREPNFAQPVRPLFAGRLNPDMSFFGFPFGVQQARGAGGPDGYYFVFQEHPTAQRFGLDEAARAGYGGTPAHWADLDWHHLAADAAVEAALVTIDVGPGRPLWDVTRPDSADPDPLTHRWGFSAASMAHILLQRPVQVAIHASRLLAKPASG